METASETEVQIERPILQYRGETDTLVYKKDRFIVREGTKWIYYLAKSTPTETDKFVDFSKAPPVYKDGFFAYNRRFYPISKRDVVRGHFLNNEAYAFTLKQLVDIYEPTHTAETSKVATPDQNNALGEEAAGGDRNQPGSGDLTKKEANDLNLAWDEQVRTLLAIQDPEEEWDI